MKATYDQAVAQVLKDEGGYTNESTDPGGPTNWGITLHDARQFWKEDATAEDVKDMPKSVAYPIYRKHYADPIQYDSLPAGVDYAIFDYGINSGISRSVKTVQKLVGAEEDGILGPITLERIRGSDPISLIRSIYIQRLEFLKGLHTWNVYGHGWTNRCTHGRDFAISLAQEYATKPISWWQKILNYLKGIFI